MGDTSDRTIIVIGHDLAVDRRRQGNLRLTSLAIGQMVRRHRDSLDTALAKRGYVLIDYADQGPGRGMEFEIGQA